MARNQQQYNGGVLKQKAAPAEIVRWLRRLPLRTLEKAESRPARGIAVGIGVLIVLWLLFSRVYIPLNQEAGLPGSVTDRNPQLRESDINFLTGQYEERLRHVPRSYAEYRGLFTAAP